MLNGPAGVGKTTVGRLLAGAARNGVCIHGDDLKNFVVARDLASVSTGLSYVGAAALVDVFLEGGYELVVVDFIFSRPDHLDRFETALRSQAPVSVFTLWAPLEVVKTREASRPGRKRLGPRVGECWADLARYRTQLGITIDATVGPIAIADEIQRQLALASTCPSAWATESSDGRTGRADNVAPAAAAVGVRGRAADGCHQPRP